MWPFKWKLRQEVLSCNTVFIKLYKVALILKCDHSNESYWAVLSCDTVFIKLYKVALILKCDHSNESYWAVLSCDTVFIKLYKVALILKCDHSNESYWAVLSCDTVFIKLYKVALILKCDHSNESYWALAVAAFPRLFSFWRLSLWMKRWSITVEMKASEKHFPVELFITLYKDCFNLWVCGRNL